MHSDLSVQLFAKLFKQIGQKWPQFIRHVKEAADGDDESQVSFDEFAKLVKAYGGRLAPPEFEEIRMAFPGKEGGTKEVRVNVGRIYDQKYN